MAADYEMIAPTSLEHEIAHGERALALSEAVRDEDETVVRVLIE